MKAFVRESRHDPPELGADPGADLALLLGLISASTPAVPADQMVILDIETTGLSSGAATLVILVGLAFFDQGRLVVRQYFAPEPAAEPDVLGAVADVLRSSELLVTFNGKSFDVPMLANRFHLHRLTDPTPPRHLDVLHPARRIWRRRLGQCGLANLEARVLGVARDGDVPSYEIPQRYFDYLRQQRWDLIAPVLDHNRQDLVSLARLTLRIAALLRDPAAAGTADPRDLLGLGWLLEMLERRDAARACYELALAGAAPVDRSDALHRLAVLAHQSNELERAVELYEVVATYPTPRAMTASRELARIYERQIGDTARALVHARRALQLLALTRDFAAKRSLDPARRTVERLERKLGVFGTSIAVSSGGAPR